MSQTKAIKKNKTLPLVSIVIPVYNGSKYVKKAINSALDQNYDNYEIIVVNDGSSDRGATDRICRSYGKKIRYFKKENGGVATALNLAISKMKGEYFSWLSHDDVYLPNKVSSQIEYLKTNQLMSKKVILYSNYALIDKNSKQYTDLVIDHEFMSKKPQYALYRGVLNGCTMLVPKAAFEQCGNFDESLRCTQDYDLWFKMYSQYSFVHVPEILVQYRCHPDQTTNTSPSVISEGNDLWLKILKSQSKKDILKLESNEYIFWAKFFDFLKVTPYNKASDYALNQMKKYPKSKYSPEDITSRSPIGPEPYSKYKLIRIMQIIHREGLSSFARGVYRKYIQKTK